MKEYIPHITTQEVEKLVKDYPFCAGYKVLLASRLSDQPNFVFKKILQTAAVYTQDRGMLFTLLNEPHNLEDDFAKATIFKQENISISDSKIEDNNTDDRHKEPEKNAEDGEINEEVVNDKTIDQANTEEEQTVETLATDDTEEIPTVEKDKEIDVVLEYKDSELSKESKDDKIDFDDLVTYNPITELKPLPKKEDKKREPRTVAGYDPERELAKLLDKPKKKVSEENSFLNWLNMVQENKNEAIPEPIKPEAKEKQSNVDDVQSVLDKFLATKKTRPIKKTEFYKPENKAETSATEDFSIVTETLADIYKRQGLFDLAIKVYRKLMLHNPNKKENFAAQIKELEKLIK
jgi:hypothetical protein